MVDGLAGVIIGFVVDDLIGVNVEIIDGYVLGDIVGFLVHYILKYKAYNDDGKGVSGTAVLDMTDGVEYCITLIRLIQL